MAVLEKLGIYTIEATLGSGSLADVYRALDTDLTRRVALKVLKAGIVADESAFKRFKKQVAATTSLVHPHAAWLWEVGAADGYYYLAQRLLDAQPLSATLKRPLAWEEALTICIEAGSALQYAHNLGIVHGYLKPSNILVNAVDGAVITNFGLALALQRYGEAGSARYRAPEVWDDDLPSPASDQYALACILVEMVTGKPLVDGQGDMVIERRQIDLAALPPEWEKAAPPGTAAVMRRALAKKPGERYQAVADFVADLEEPGGKVKEAEKKARRAADEHAQPVSRAEEEIVPQKVAKISSPLTSALKSSDQEEESQGQRLSIRLAKGVEMEFKYVPAGKFLMGSLDTDKEAGPEEKPQHTVYLDEYWMGRCPVTVQQFTAFTKASKYQTTADKEGWAMIWNGKEWVKMKGANWAHPDGPDSNVLKQQEHPVTQISYQDALEFCLWLNSLVQLDGIVVGPPVRLHLPSEAQWEKAARGTDGRIFPWGNEKADKDRCNLTTDVNTTTPVGKYSPLGDSPYGCVDMAGNTYDWTSSLMRDFPYKADDGREDASSSEVRVVRGGAFGYWYKFVRCCYRFKGGSSLGARVLGFRVCATPLS